MIYLRGLVMKRAVVLFALFSMAATLSFGWTRGDQSPFTQRIIIGTDWLVVRLFGLEYHRKITIRVTLEMAGLLTTLGVSGSRVYQHIYPPVTPRLGVGTAPLVDANAVASELFGSCRTGPPARLVGY